MTPWLWSIGGLGVLGALSAVWMIAYRVGFAEGRTTVPLRLVHQLVEHKVACCHERPERVALELSLLLDVPESESRRLVSRIAGRSNGLGAAAGMSSASPHAPPANDAGRHGWPAAVELQAVARRASVAAS